MAETGIANTSGKFAVVRWLNDGNKLSVHNVKYFIDPIKKVYVPGDEGVSCFPGEPGKWNFRVLAFGGRQEMNAWLQRNFNILTADVNDENFIKDSQSEVTSTTPVKVRPNEGVKKDKPTDGTLTPVNNGLSNNVQKKLTGGEAMTPIDNGSNEGGEKVVGKKDKQDKQATGVTTTIPANNEPNENRKLAVGDSTTPLPVISGSNVGLDKSHGNMGNHKQLTDAVLQQTAQKKIAESLLLKRTTGVQNDTHKDCVSKKEFNALKEDLRTLKDEFRRLKRKIRSDQEQVDSDQPLENKKSLCTASPKLLLTTSDEKELATSSKSETPTSPSEMLSFNDEVKYNNHTMSDLEDSISHEDNLYSAVKILMLKLFPESYIISHSVTGKPSNSKVDAKPQFDRRLYNILLSVIKKKFGSTKDVTAKVHSVQKVLQKHYTK